MRTSFRLAVVCAVLLGLSFTALGQVRSGPVPRVTAAVDARQTVELAGSLGARVALSRDLGRVDPSLATGRMVLTLQGTPEQEQAFADAVDDLHNPSSPNFHRWLTPETVAARFGVASADVAQTAAWLRASGLTVQPARSGRFLTFEGPVGAVEAAFGTELHQFERNGQTYLANSLPVHIPAALAPVVAGVATLSTSAVHDQAIVKGTAKVDLAKGAITFPGSETHALSPGDFAILYNLKPLFAAGITGAGQQIAVIGRSTSTLAEAANFRTLFKLPVNTPQLVVNGTTPVNVGADFTEAALDTEWSGATAPGAQVIFVTSPSLFNDGIEPSIAYAIDNNIAGILTLSYSSCEQASAANDAFFLSAWKQAAAQGITVTVSTGDNGGANCDSPANSYARFGLAVSGLASTPYNTAVGGTQFDDTANPSQYWSLLSNPDLSTVLGYIPEVVWNESSIDPLRPSLEAGSGGASILYGKPVWQTGVGVPADGHRDIPDLSLSAAGHDGYAVCNGGCAGTSPSLVIVGGTSASTPSFAGIMALVDQKLGGRQGLANYLIYPLAAKHPEAFHDIVTGNNKVTDVNGVQTVGYNAGPGYDLATGLGSLDVTAFVNNLAVAAALATPAIALSGAAGSTVAHGAPFPVKVTVTAAPGKPVPTGSVAFLAESTALTNATLDAAGTATVNLTNIPGGAHGITARYAGDGSYTAATSSPALAVTVGKENSVTSFVTPYQGATLPYGDPLSGVLLSVAGVSGQGNPSGSVSVGEGGNMLATAPLTVFDQNTGSTVVSVYNYLGAKIPFNVGKHTVVASYTGDGTFNASSTDGVASKPLTFTVVKVDCNVLYNSAVSSAFIAGFPGTLKTFVRMASYPNSPYGGTLTITDVTDAKIP